MTEVGISTQPSQWSLSPTVYLKKENGTYHFYKRGASDVLISEVVMPALDLTKVPTDHIGAVIKKMQHRLHEFEDKTTKLYVDLTLKGGVTNIIEYIQQNEQATPSDISKQIQTNLPENTFTWVQVSNCKYAFFGEKVKARAIMLKPGSTGLKRFAASVKLLFGGNALNPNKLYNLTPVGNLILGIEDTPEEEADLKDLYNHKRVIIVYLSLDGENMFVDIESSGCSIL